MFEGDNVLIIKGVLKGRKGIIKEILFNTYKVRLNPKEVYWFDTDEIEKI
ncbi:MAG: hypothetical protein K0S34_785 [Bacillales bacterium]|jgi:ribosomal protein L24|nr:hypothetical protein [Bacillales bacterium]